MYIYIYIYKYVHLLFHFSVFVETMQTNVYKHRGSLKLIAIFEINKYNVEHTNNTKIHFQNQFSNIHIFQKLDIHFNQRFPPICMPLFQNLPGSITPPFKKPRRY